jgi:hypothetical protein
MHADLRSPWRGVVAAMAMAALAALAGCASSTATVPAPSAPASAAPTTALAAPAGGVVISGDVHSPGPVTSDRLAALPQHTVDVQFGSGKGPEKHTETGVLLADLIGVPALATTSRKNDQLAFAVLATGADGYAALVSYGEIAPDFGNRGVLLATTQDGAALGRPRLVVPGDVKGGRYVSDVVELRVVRVG